MKKLRCFLFDHKWRTCFDTTYMVHPPVIIKCMKCRIRHYNVDSSLSDSPIRLGDKRLKRFFNWNGNRVKRIGTNKYRRALRKAFE